MCGADEKSTNHVFFECSQALQTRTLSRIHSLPEIFPSSLVFTSIYYLFWKLPKEDDYSYFPWILQGICKFRNDKIYLNKNENPQEILRIAVSIKNTLGGSTTDGEFARGMKDSFSAILYVDSIPPAWLVESAGPDT